MKFADVILLNGIWLLLPLGVLLYFFIQVRKKRMHAFVDEKLIKDVAPSFNIKNNYIRSALLLGVFLFTILAFARPQWGFEWQEVRRESLDILVVIDVSKSMLTQDVRPNRLERTKLAVIDLLRKLRGDRIGLVAFAGDAFLLCPLTVDYNGFLLSLNDLSPETIPRGGTNIPRAIELALNSYKETPNQFKSIVVITDGDNLEGDPMEWAKKAKDQGVKIYTIGIGTAEGELIRIVGEDGLPQFLKDQQGNFVKSRLNEELLQKISLSTDGTYVKSSGAEFGLEWLYDNYLSNQERREMDAQMEKQFHERFQIPLALALILLITETVFPNLKRKDEKN